MDNSTPYSTQSVRVSDFVDPALIYQEVVDIPRERQDGQACMVRGQDEGTRETGGEQWDFNHPWQHSPLVVSDQFCTGSFASAYPPCNEYLNVPLGYETNPSFSSIRTFESELWDDAFQAQPDWQSTYLNRPDRLGSSDSRSLSDDMSSSTIVLTPGDSPELWVNSDAGQNLYPQNTLDARQNSLSDYSTQYQSSLDRQVNLTPSPLSNTKVGDDDSITISICHTTPLESGPPLHLRDHATSKGHDGSHNTIPGCGVLNFSRIGKGKSKSVNKETNERKKSQSLQGQRKLSIPKRRAKHGAICVRCKLFKEGCSGSYPCKNCQDMTGSTWPSICVRANLTELNCYKKSLYGYRLKIHSGNVREWCDKIAFQPVRIMVGVGLKSLLPLTVYKFHPYDASLLDHVSWRLHSDNELIRTPSSPWGLCGVMLKTNEIDRFMDELVEELISEPRFQQKDAIWVHTFQIALARSRDTRPDAVLLQNSLRMWAAQSLWFDRIWRITAEGEKIDAPWRDSTQARDVPKLLYMQLDFSMEAYIIDLERRILADLNRFIFKRSSSTWLSVYAAAFIFLVTLENDSWRLETWKVKLKAWENLPPVIRPSLPVWPLPNNPDHYLEQNNYHARIIAAHVRAGCKGFFPFSTNVSGQVVANTSSTDEQIKNFVVNIQEELGSFGQNMMLRGAVSGFRPGDFNSLDYSFAAKLLMDDD